MTDAAELTAELIRCPSVTPEEAGALTLLADRLLAAGFEVTRIDRNGTPNLFARWGAKGAGQTFGFNGHTDVVPPGNLGSWAHPPFSGHLDEDGMIWGRGATDMKSGVAAFVAASIDFVTETPPADGAVILTITGDEEGASRDGTLALLDWMDAQGEAMDVCIVGEPSNPNTFGEMMKIGRRGSLTCWFTAHGVQGHAAYPHRAKNPMSALIKLLHRLEEQPLDTGSDHFDASTLVITTIDCGNPATNVIPARGQATVNIRFNDLHSGESLSRWLTEQAAAVAADTGTRIESRIQISGESFLTEPGPFSALVRDSVAAETGVTPSYSTSGGTSDARFVKDHCPVVEFGLVGKTMHQVNERVEVAQIHQLKAIYARILRDYFA